jgi:hypothetical protein
MDAGGVRRGMKVDETVVGEGPQVREAIGGIGRQIEDIISSAEQFADETRARAEADGEQLLERRSSEAEHAAIEREAAAAEVTARVDAGLREVLASIEGVREQLLTAARGLEITAGRVESDLERLTHPADAPDATAAAANGRQTPAVEKGPEASVGAAKEASPPVVLASQMALSGMSPAEIAATLRDRFAIADPDPIVERALAREP